jgi:hypothetical protein
LIPPGLNLEALELSRRTEFHGPGMGMEPPLSIPRIVSSDAHLLEDIGTAYTVLLLAEPTLAELRVALRGEGGRRIVRRMDRGMAIS